MKQASIICSALLQVNAQSLFKGFASNQSTVSLVTSPLPETHNLAQPLPQVCITWLELQQHCLQYALVQFQKF